MSREIDIEIAEEIMKLTVIKDQKTFDLHKNWQWELGQDKIYLTPKIWNNNFSGIMWGFETIPFYSTSIARSQKILEIIKPFVNFIAPQEDQWNIVLVLEQSDHGVTLKSASVLEDTLEMAICKAALRLHELGYLH